MSDLVENLTDWVGQNSHLTRVFSFDFLRNLAFGCGAAAVTSAILVELYKKVKTSKFGKIGF